jgi:hypothetical protein
VQGGRGAAREGTETAPPAQSHLGSHTTEFAIGTAVSRCAKTTDRAAHDGAQPGRMSLVPTTRVHSIGASGHGTGWRGYRGSDLYGGCRTSRAAAWLTAVRLKSCVPGSRKPVAA